MCQPKKPRQTLEARAIDARVEVVINGGSTLLGGPAFIAIYDDPDRAVLDAIAFLTEALSARRFQRNAEPG